jgi:transposase InsO family protein
MRQERLVAKAARGRRASTTDSRHALPVAPNLVQKDFHASQPNQLWGTDVTYIRTLEGWLYLAVVIDLYARRVVGWGLSEQNDRFLVMSAARMAFRRRKPPQGLIVHSDRGSTFCSHDFQDLLNAHGCLSSMGAKGDCYDNACAESFFHTFKVEWLYDEPLRSRRDTADHIIEYVELFYNRVRIHSSLGYLSPCVFESA